MHPVLNQIQMNLEWCPHFHSILWHDSDDDDGKYEDLNAITGWQVGRSGWSLASRYHQPIHSRRAHHCLCCPPTFLHFVHHLTLLVYHVSSTIKRHRPTVHLVQLSTPCVLWSAPGTINPSYTNFLDFVVHDWLRFAPKYPFCTTFIQLVVTGLVHYQINPSGLQMNSVKFATIQWTVAWQLQIPKFSAYLEVLHVQLKTRCKFSFFSPKERCSSRR